MGKALPRRYLLFSIAIAIVAADRTNAKGQSVAGRLPAEHLVRCPVGLDMPYFSPKSRGQPAVVE